MLLSAIHVARLFRTFFSGDKLVEICGLYLVICSQSWVTRVALNSLFYKISTLVPDSKAESKGDSKDKKRKSPDEEIFEDDDFDNMMQDIDFDQEIGMFKVIILSQITRAEF
jgi:hypothetical protein